MSITFGKSGPFTVLFLASGVWIHPCDSERFQFDGTAAEFLALLVADPRIDVASAQILVHG